MSDPHKVSEPLNALAYYRKAQHDAEIAYKVENAHKVLCDRFTNRDVTDEQVKSAAASVLHTFGDYRTNTMSQHNFDEALSVMEREISAIEWIRNNPHTAFAIAKLAHRTRGFGCACELSHFER
jgi:hypothetical protein